MAWSRAPRMEARQPGTVRGGEQTVWVRAGGRDCARGLATRAGARIALAVLRAALLARRLLGLRAAAFFAGVLRAVFARRAALSWRSSAVSASTRSAEGGEVVAAGHAELDQCALHAILEHLLQAVPGIDGAFARLADAALDRVAHDIGAAAGELARGLLQRQAFLHQRLEQLGAFGLGAAEGADAGQPDLLRGFAQGAWTGARPGPVRTGVAGGWSSSRLFLSLAMLPSAGVGVIASQDRARV